MNKETEKKVLFALSEGAKTAKDLVHAVGVARRTIYTARQRLITSGLVKAVPYFKDARQSVFVLTEQGRQAVTG